MVSFDDITKIFSIDLEGKYCIEIEFVVKGHPKYQSCWMGKSPDKENRENDIYWYGLVPDGSESYDYDNFKDFSHSTVFDGKSLKEILNKVEIWSIDGCDPEERLISRTG